MFRVHQGIIFSCNSSDDFESSDEFDTDSYHKVPDIQININRGCGEEQAVEAVEDAAVTGNKLG